MTGFSAKFVFVAALFWALAAPAHAFGLPGDFAGWWLTPDQQGQRLASRGQYLEAAEAFRDPARKGAAYYRGVCRAPMQRTTGEMR